MTIKLVTSALIPKKNEPYTKHYILVHIVSPPTAADPLIVICVIQTSTDLSFFLVENF